MLKYPPFAASARLQAAARNHRPLVMNERGPAIAIFQGGLVQVGMSLPVTVRSGVPDGVYGTETFKAVKRFQTDQGLAQVDGFAGRDTLRTLDDMLTAAAGMTFPVPLGPPSSPVDPNYELGNSDPKRGHDPGAGVWNSTPTEMSYRALKASIIASLPGAAAVIGVDATKNMWHYLRNSGTPQTIDLEGMVRDVPSAKERYEDEVDQAKQYVETLPTGNAPDPVEDGRERVQLPEGEHELVLRDRWLLVLGPRDRYRGGRSSEPHLFGRVRVQVL